MLEEFDRIQKRIERAHQEINVLCCGVQVLSTFLSPRMADTLNDDEKEVMRETLRLTANRGYVTSLVIPPNKERAEE